MTDPNHIYHHHELTCARKRWSFDTKAEAKAHIKGAGKRIRKTLMPYLCSHCGRWHCGTKERAR